MEEGDVAALVKSHMNNLQPFESTIEQTTETMLPSHKTITADARRQIELQAYESSYTTDTKACLVCSFTRWRICLRV